jgi:hypothetical protein
VTQEKKIAIGKTLSHQSNFTRVAVWAGWFLMARVAIIPDNNLPQISNWSINS